MRNAILLGLMGLALGLALSAMLRGPGRDIHSVGIENDAPAPSPRREPIATPELVAPPRLDPDLRALAIEEAGAEDPDAEDPESFVPLSDTGAPRVDRLIAAGFTPARADEILHSEARLRLEVFGAEYAATGTIRPLNSGAQTAIAERLRQQMGDADYERYLAAVGQPTRVVIGSVDPSSAAANAGLLPGDEIVSYAGRRVFNLRDLNALMLQAAEGEIVPATVVRDGQSLQLYVASGPLGLSPPITR